jgi:hypothetical protein
VLASEGHEVGLALASLMDGKHCGFAAREASRVLAGIQRIEQKFLVNRHLLHSILEQRRLGGLCLPAAQEKTRRREPADQGDFFNEQMAFGRGIALVATAAQAQYLGADSNPNAIRCRGPTRP